MAILQISQITNRKGLQADLPQLAGAELGWSIDERRLWIGNGTIAEGAPVIGNTEIITEYSNIEAILNYTYSGYSASGYTIPSPPSEPVSYQDWFDQYASVLDFGISGDGLTDVTTRLNEVLFQMYCVDPTNTAAKRALFFPAGTYIISGPILIPANATLVGEGPESSIIQLTGAGYVAQTVDSTQTAGGASSNISITNLGFQNLGTGSVFLLQNSTNTTFNKVAFLGSQDDTTIPTTTDTSSGVQFTISPSYSIEQVVFDECTFYGTVYGVNTEENITGVTFTNSYFNTLLQGLVLGTDITTTQGPTGIRVANCVFDVIYGEGIVVGTTAYPDGTQLITTGHNVFLDVGNEFVPGTPVTPVIIFNSDNNLSIGDMFARTDADALIQPRISIVGNDNINSQNGASISLGQYTRKSSRVESLDDNTTATLFTQDVTNMQAFSFQYTVFRNPGVAAQTVRTGTFSIASNVNGVLNWGDDYIENGTTGIALTAARAGNTVTVTYATTSLGTPGLMQYSINYFN